MNIDWNNGIELNAYPAFGERNEHALTNKGESPYMATKTFPVQFSDSSRREELQTTIEDSLVAEQQNGNVYSYRGR